MAIAMHASEGYYVFDHATIIIASILVNGSTQHQNCIPHCACVPYGARAVTSSEEFCILEKMAAMALFRRYELTINLP